MSNIAKFEHLQKINRRVIKLLEGCQSEFDVLESSILELAGEGSFDKVSVVVQLQKFDLIKQIQIDAIEVLKATSHGNSCVDSDAISRIAKLETTRKIFRDCLDENIDYESSITKKSISKIDFF